MSQISTLKIRLQRKITIEITIIERSEQRRERERERGGEKERPKEVSINNAHPRLEDVEDRKINHPSSLAFLPTFIRTTIGREREGFSNKQRGSSNLSSFPRFLLNPTPPPPAFFAFQGRGTNKERDTFCHCVERRPPLHDA